MTKTFTFPADKRHIGEIYTAEANKTSDPEKWPHTHVQVFHHAPDGTKTQVYEYGRNYSMMKTFEPFRQWKDGVWHYYALISPFYTSFEVLDLESGEVIAKRPMPTITQEWMDSVIATTDPKRFEPGGYYEKYHVGMEMPGWGFCPMDFWVPDIFNDATDTTPEKHAAFWDANEDWDVEAHDPYLLGHLGFVGGCTWGDDSSAKLRAIDLSRISEGIVTEDERFGYFELAGKLKESIYIDEDSMTVNTPIHVNPITGKSSYYSTDGINFETEEEAKSR